MTQSIGIVGTGLSGLTAALALGTDRAITLIGETPTAAKDERTTAVLSPGIDFLKELKLWPACAAQAVPLMTMELIDGNDSFVYDASETQRNEFGFNVPNAVLRQTLLQAIARNRNITWIKENVANAIRKNTTWQLTTTGKKKIDLDVVVAADGRNSFLRQAAAIDIETRDENQVALVAVVEASKAHHYTSVEWYRAGGPLTFVPMDGKKLAIVWCEDQDTAAVKKNQPLSTLSKELTAITAQRYGTLTFLTKPQAWPIAPMKAECLVKDNIVLIGEAAHVLPPIGAQGFNTSLHDIKALQQIWTKAETLGLPLTDKTMLQQYERTRSKDVTLRYYGMTKLNDLIRTQNPALAFLRGTGLRSLRRLSPLRKKIMAFGLGTPHEDAA